MKYYKPIVDPHGYIHSIDMVYSVYWSRMSIVGWLDEIRKLHELYPEIRYDEHLNRPCSSRYDYFKDGIAIGGAYIEFGKYTDYDRLTKTFRLLDQVQLRVNPNKYMCEPWFRSLLRLIWDNCSGGWLRKYDYAVDIPLPPSKVQVCRSRKEPGLYKGTRYFGQQGRHGYCKVYDKQKELERKGEKIPPLTRVEHTQMVGKPQSLEEVFILSETVLKDDLSGLNDTDRAIVSMYRELKALGSNYELSLGRGKMDKLKDYITGNYVALDYGDILNQLLSRITFAFGVSDSLPQDEWELQDEELPFD